MTLELDLSVARDLSIATLAGLAVGIERERSGHASGPDARFAGARTFMLLGLLGGLAGWLTQGGLGLPGALLLAGGAALSVAAYVIAARRGPLAVDGTTETAALVVLALGMAAGLGFPLLTSAAASLMVLVLAEKTRIHALIERINERDFAAALRFAVLALVLLPLLPQGPYGPHDSIRPRMLWAIVLFFSGLNFIGYVARRAIGETRGYGLTGLLGGMLSSTVVTLTFARRSREDSHMGGALGLGVIAACTMLFARVLVVAAVLNRVVAWALLPYLVPPVVVGAAFAVVGVRRAPRRIDQQAAITEPRSPLGLWSAIKMALAFQLVLFAIPLVHEAWGSTGVLTSAVVVGITDMDALTMSMARLGAERSLVALAAQAIALGALASTLFKLAITVGLGTAGFRGFASLGLAALAVALGLGFLLR